MDDKHLDELLHEMKKDYEKMPEYIDNQTVIKSIFAKRKKRIWARMVPSVAVVAGLFLFILITLPFLDMDQRAGNQNDALREHFVEAKEKFKKSLGLENVDGFSEVKQAKRLVEDFEAGDANDFENTKSEINRLLETPEMLLTRLKQSGELDNDTDYSRLKDIIRSLSSFQASAQDYFTTLITLYDLGPIDLVDIIKYQDKIMLYDGPEEIEQFLEMLNKQGFFIAGYPSELKVKVDFYWLIHHVESRYGDNDAYLAYLDLFTTIIDPESPGIYNDYGTEWSDFDEVLLEIEEFQAPYDKEEHSFFIDTLYHYMMKYLEDYLTCGVEVGEKLDENAQYELNNFLKQHTDSKYWTFVHMAVREYEANNWVRTNFTLYPDVVRFLFEEKLVAKHFDDIIRLEVDPHLAPNEHFIHALYKDYHLNHEIIFLENVSSFDVMLLFIHAFSQDDFETVDTLYTKESRFNRNLHNKVKEFLFADIPDMEYFVFIEELSEENSVNYTFVMFEVEDDVSPESWNESKITGSIKMKKEDGIWKVHELE